MNNIFSEIEDKIFFDESIIFDEAKINQFVTNFLINKLNSEEPKKRGFYFEGIILDFFEYINLETIQTKKTRDFGIDGIVKIQIGIFGEINLGIQIKNKLIDSTDIDSFIANLKNCELQLRVIVCRDSRNLSKYELNNKLKAILLSRGIELKQKITSDININPVFVLKLDEIIEIIASNIRSVVKAIYKK